MKKKPLLNEKIIEEFQDSYLEDLMKDYNTLKERSDEEVEDIITIPYYHIFFCLQFYFFI